MLNVGSFITQTSQKSSTATSNASSVPATIRMIAAISGIHENPNQVYRSLTHPQRQLGLLGPAPGPLVEDPRELQRSVRNKRKPQR